MSYSSVIVITELASNGTDALRYAILEGPALPFMGAAWGGELGVTTTWYPGNSDEATQQVLGPREVPSSWNGEWRRTMMGRTPSTIRDDSGVEQKIVDPAVLRDFLESLFRSGRRLRVVWSVEQAATLEVGVQLATIHASIRREGRCTKWNFKHRGHFDIEWDMNWEWVGRGGVTPKVSDTRSGGVVQQAAAYNAKLQALIDANKAAQLAKFKPHTLTLGQLEALANYPSALVKSLSRTALKLENQIVDVTNIAKAVASQPYQIANLALDHARNARALAADTHAQLSRVPAELLTVGSKAVDVLRAHKAFGPVQDNAILAGIGADVFITSVRKTVPQHSPALSGRLRQTEGDPSTILATYITKDGDTPKKISQRFYKVPDHDIDILRANRRAWHTPSFTKGTILIIPRLDGTTRGT